MGPDDPTAGDVLNDPDAAAVSSGEGEQPVGRGEVGSHARKRRLWAQILVIVGVLVLVCSGAVVLGTALLTHRYEDRVQRADILKDVPKPQPATVDKPPLNFLVLGSDSRDPDARGFDATGDRSDTIMIVHIPQGHTSAFIFSIPRDSYVYVAPTGNWPGGMNKINAAMAYGGGAAAANTIYQLTHIPLDGAFIVDFGGLQRLVGIVGTVHVCIPYDVTDPLGDAYTWSAGCHDMDPEEAQYFTQMRYGTPGGDFGRIYDQQLVAKALASQIASSGTLTNPLKLDRLITTVAESVTVDQNTDLRALILELKDISPDNISFATVPYLGTMTTDAGSSVALDNLAAQELFQAVLNDRTDDWLAAHPQNPPQGFGPNGTDPDID